MNDVTDLYQHRKADFTPTEDQALLAASVRSFLEGSVDLPSLRDATGPDFDPALHRGLADLGLFAMVISEVNHGDGGSFSEACLVSEEIGWTLAPVAYTECVVVAGVLDRVLLDSRENPDSDTVRAVLSSLLDGSVVAALAMEPGLGRQILSVGAAASYAIFLTGDHLVLLPVAKDSIEPLDAMGRVPVARWSGSVLSEGGITLATGRAAHEIYDQAVARWRILAAARLIGLTDRALHWGVDFAKVRQTRGAAIGSLQAISHPLVDTLVSVESSRNLTRKAAWYLDNEPFAQPELPIFALLSAVKTVRDGTVTAVHVHGGQGVSVESDVSLVFTRANALSTLAGNTDELARQAGQAMFERLSQAVSHTVEV